MEQWKGRAGADRTFREQSMRAGAAHEKRKCTSPGNAAIITPIDRTSARDGKLRGRASF